MSELFENLELQMREEAEAKNPRSAILASQMESEKRFASFISSNVGRITVIENELKEIAYKYASQYDVDPQMVFEAVAESLIKNAADENDEDQTEEILKFWESVSPEMAEKYRKKITPPKMKNEKGEIVDATDEALARRSEDFAKKNIEHDPNAVLEGVDREMKSRGDSKCRNCGSHTGVKNYGEAGDFCSVKCGMKYIKKHESSSKTAEWEPPIEDENIEQLDLLGEILDAENAGDFNTVASLSRQYKQQYGRITPAMMEKARNRDFAVRELDEDFGPGVRGNDLGDNFDDREASVKRSENQPPWYLDTEQEIGDWQAHMDGLADARSDYEAWWLSLTPEEQRLWEEKESASDQIESRYRARQEKINERISYLLYNRESIDPEIYKKEAQEVLDALSQSSEQKKAEEKEFENTWGERNNPQIRAILNKRSSAKTAETQRQQERKAAFQEIMNAKKSGVPHDDILEMLKDYKADFGRNFSTDSQKKQAGELDHFDSYDLMKAYRNLEYIEQQQPEAAQEHREEFEKRKNEYLQEAKTRIEDIKNWFKREQTVGEMWGPDTGVGDRLDYELNALEKFVESVGNNPIDKQASLEDLTNRQLANEYTGILRMLKEDPSLEEKFRTLIMGMERELKSRRIEDPNEYERAASVKRANLDDDMERDDDYDVAREMRNEYEVSPNNYPHWISTLKYFDKEGNPDYLNVVNAIAKGYNLTPQEVIDIYNDYRNQPFRESSIKEAALAAFIEANQDVLFPEWMIREAGGKSWKGMTWKDMIDLSNANKNYNELGPQGEVDEATDPEAAVNAQQGVQGLVPGSEVSADEQPTAVFDQATMEQPAVGGDSGSPTGNGWRERVDARNQEWLQNKLMELQRAYQMAQGGKGAPEQRATIMKQIERLFTELNKGERGKFYYSSAPSLEQKLVKFYVKAGVAPKTAAIFVQSVGEMAQLQQSNPGLPIAAPDPETMDINKEIGGKEGDKYQNWHVDEKQRGLGIEHQDFTDFGEPVREFIQPGGEAPYSENTSDKIDEGGETTDMSASGVTQADNAPKQSKVAGNPDLDRTMLDLEGDRIDSMRNLPEDDGRDTAFDDSFDGIDGSPQAMSDEVLIEEFNKAKRESERVDLNSSELEWYVALGKEIEARGLERYV